VQANKEKEHRTDEGRLIDSWIRPDPVQPGVEEARIMPYGVQVWAIIGHLQATGESPAQAAEDYNIPEEAVAAALAYFRRHRAAIETRLAANAA